MLDVPDPWRAGGDANLFGAAATMLHTLDMRRVCRCSRRRPLPVPRHQRSVCCRLLPDG